MGLSSRLQLSSRNSVVFFLIMVFSTPGSSTRKELKLPIATSWGNWTLILKERKGSILTPPDIWNFRKRHNLTGADLARILGVHKSQVSRWETGQRPIPLWLEKFLACLDQTLPVRTSARASSKPNDSGVAQQGNSWEAGSHII